MHQKSRRVSRLEQKKNAKMQSPGRYSSSGGILYVASGTSLSGSCSSACVDVGVAEVQTTEDVDGVMESIDVTVDDILQALLESECIREVDSDADVASLDGF